MKKLFTCLIAAALLALPALASAEVFAYSDTAVEGFHIELTNENARDVDCGTDYYAVVTNAEVGLVDEGCWGAIQDDDGTVYIVAYWNSLKDFFFYDATQFTPVAPGI